MSSEQPTPKKKNTKKYIIITLIAALVVFLLLPVVDDSTGAEGAAANKKKAIPQIFTSNPLSKLVRQVYNILSGKNKRQAHNLVARNEDGAPVEADVTRAAAQQLMQEQGDTLSGGSYASNGYIQDEDGEWVLVQQLSPESSQRGIHEVNSSDTAYDRFVRSERQAKWSGQTAKQEIPQSKWARLWQPIKNFFARGKDQEKDKELLASAGSARAVGSGKFGSNGRSSADRGGSRTPSQDFAKAGNINWNASSSFANDFSMNAEPSDALRALLKDPTKAIKDRYKQLDKFARENLSKEDYAQWKNNADKNQQAHSAEMEEVFSTAIANAAEGKEQVPDMGAKFYLTADKNSQDHPDVLDGKNSCGGEGKIFPSAFHVSTTSSCKTYKPYQSDKQQVQETREQTRQMMNKILPKEFQLAETDPGIPVLMVLGVYPPGSPNPLKPQSDDETEQDDPAQSQPQDAAPAGTEEQTGEEAAEEKPLSPEEIRQINKQIYDTKYIDWIYKHEGCDNNPCALVPTAHYQRDDLRDALDSGMMDPVFVDLSADEESAFVVDLIKDLEQNPNPQMQKVVDELRLNFSEIQPAYSLVSVERAKQIMDKRNQKTGLSTQVLTETGAEADAARKAGLASSFNIIYLETSNNEEGDHTLLQAGQDPIRAGQKMGTRAARILSVKTKMYQDAEEKIGTNDMAPIMSKVAKQTAKSMESNNPKNLDAQMGLDKRGQEGKL